MKNLKIKLASGKDVTLEAFHMTTTYEGLLAGEPAKELNEKIIDNLSYPKNWGVRKSYTEKSNMYLSKLVLKPLVFSARLSAEPVNDKGKQFDGSEIIVIWLGETIRDINIEELIVSGLGHFDWDKHANNFQF
jgi:hypothetical protein